MTRSSVRQQLVERATELHEILSRASASSPRPFGSVARGKDHADSDVDVLVDVGPGCSLPDLCRAEQELEDAFGRPFGLVTSAGLHPSVRSEALDQGVPL